MAVYHYLKDGTRVDDITGHVVKMADAEPLYNLMRQMSEEPRRKRPVAATIQPRRDGAPATA